LGHQGNIAMYQAMLGKRK